MALPIRKVSAQLQLSDAVKRDYPGSAVVSLLIQQLANMPTLTGGGGKVLAVNSEETAIELITRPAGSGTTTFTTVTDFPGSPTNNQIILLTQKQGANEVGFYQYRVSRWVALFIQSAELDLPVGQTLPSVATAGSLFFLTQAHLTNSSGVYFRTGSPLAWVQIADNSDTSALMASLTALTTRVGTLESENPVKNITLTGSTLTITRQDNTTSDITLPSESANLTALTTRVVNLEGRNPVKTIAISGSSLTLTFQDDTTTTLTLPSGTTSWTGLDQTPDALTDGDAGQFVALNNSRTLLEFVTPSFTGLAQTPNALEANKAVHTDSTGANLILVDPPSAPTGGGVATQSIIYGNTAVKSAVDSDANAVANARTEATTAFNLPASRTTKSVALQTGGLIPVTFPDPTGYYRPYVAIPTSDVTNIRIHNLSNDENDTDNWTTTTATLNTIAYTIYVSINQYSQGRMLEWIVKNYA